MKYLTTIKLKNDLDPNQDTELRIYRSSDGMVYGIDSRIVTCSPFPGVVPYIAEIETDPLTLAKVIITYSEKVSGRGQ